MDNTTKIEVLPYTTQDFNTHVPGFEDAFARFHDINAKALVENDIRSLFLDNKMDKTFGLIVAHRHFDLEPNERLVVYGSTSTPWSGDLNNDETIKPSTWRLASDGKVQPYEFEFSIEEDKKLLNPENKAQAQFLEKLIVLLKENDAEGLFGLCKCPGDDFKGGLEITEGKANISFENGDHKFHDLPQAEVAAWFFSPVPHRTRTLISSGASRDSKK